jgi:hypothetical protein
VSRSLAAAVALGSTEAAPLVLCPWGLTFAAYTSSADLLLSCRVLMLSVCTWKAAAAKAELAAVSSSGNGSGGSKRSAGRPVLMARNLNSHAAGSKQQQQQPSAKGLSTVVEEADGALADAGTAMALSAQCAALLSQWLRGTGGDSLRQASKLMVAGGGGAAAYAAAGGAAAATFEQYIEVVECLSTVLLMLLQALPTQQARAAASSAAAAAAAAGSSGGDRSPIARAGSSTVSRAAAVAAAAAVNGSAAAVVAAATPGELSQLETALLDVLPALADASAIAISQEGGGSGAGAGGAGSTTAVEARESYAAPMLQLLIEILQHQLPHELWLGTVSQHLALVPMLGVVASRASSTDGGSGEDSAAAAAAAAVSVTDISVLELVRAVAAAPDGAMQLWQQGVLPVLVGFCRQLLHARDRHSGLLDASALGMVGPNADAAAGLGGELSAAAAASLATLGAYTTAASSGSGGGSSSSSTAQQQPAAGDGGIVWAPRHQQWCLLLELWGVLLQQLSRNVDVTATAVELLVAAEPRLLLAVQLQGSNDGVRDSSGTGGAAARQQHDGRGGASSSGPGALDFLSAFGANGASAAAASAQAAAAARLTLGNLLEAERSLRLLRFMVGHLGEWQLQRPGSLAAFRAAAASLVEFCARPSTDR